MPGQWRRIHKPIAKAMPEPLLHVCVNLLTRKMYIKYAYGVDAVDLSHGRPG